MADIILKQSADFFFYAAHKDTRSVSSLSARSGNTSPVLTACDLNLSVVQFIS